MDPARPASESSIAVSQSQAAATVPSRLGYFRWIICGLLLLGTTKNYMDRQVLGVLKTTLQHDFSWNEIQYGNLVSAFQIAYAAGMMLVGGLIDWLVSRLGYALAVILLRIDSLGS